jgi:hypothetical protein
LAKLTFALDKCIDGDDTIHSRYTADHHGPRIEKDVGLWRKIIAINGAKILIYIVTIKRYNILEYHLENWRDDTNEQINDDGAALLVARDHHNCPSSNLEEATVDAKRASRDCNVEPNLEMGHDVTVDRGPVDHILVPYNRVDALYQASNTSPSHVHAGAGIPSFKMPIEGNGTKHEAKEREGGVNRVRSISHCGIAKRWNKGECISNMHKGGF